MAKYLCIWVRAYWFSLTSFSKWLLGGSVIQVCFGISVSNFMCMSFVAVGRSLTIVSYVTSKMAALWFWIMFNCNPPIAHCHPLVWGGGILVDHWSTISSCIWSPYLAYFHTFSNTHFLNTSLTGALLYEYSHSHSALFDVVLPPLSCSFSYLYIGPSYPTPNA